MIKVRCGNCGYEWEVRPNFRPIFCDKCGAEWLSASLVFILPKEEICAFSHIGADGGIWTDKWVKWNGKKFVERADF